MTNKTLKMFRDKSRQYNLSLIVQLISNWSTRNEPIFCMKGLKNKAKLSRSNKRLYKSTNGYTILEAGIKSMYLLIKCIFIKDEERKATYPCYRITG